MRLTLVVALGVLGLASGCTRLLDFDPPDRPCDADGACLEGFTCLEGACVPGESLPIYTPPDCEGRCVTGERCTAAGVCLADTCALRVCPAGTACVEEAGSTRCDAPTAGAPGAACTLDADCTGTTGTHVCLRGTVRRDDGSVKPGLCVESCSMLGAPCTGGAGVCRRPPLGLSAGRANVCLPATVATTCTSAKDCGQEGLACALFDHPAVGPVSLCAEPLRSGAGFGEACTRTPGPGARLCANGLCAPLQGTAASPTCTEACDSTTCPSGACVLAPFTVGTLIRQVPLCVPSPSLCADCAADARACGVDAPVCATGLAVSGSAGHAKACLPSCSVEPSTGGLVCPLGADFDCVSVSDGVPALCVPARSPACP